MKYAIFALMAGAILFAGCTGGTAGKNCGADMACLETAAMACDPAFGSISLPSGNFTIAMNVEVQGGTTSQCTYYFKINDITFASQGMNAQEQQFVVAMMKGKDMTCKKAAGSLFAGNNSFTKSQCTGPLADVILQQ